MPAVCQSLQLLLPGLHCQSCLYAQVLLSDLRQQQLLAIRRCCASGLTLEAPLHRLNPGWLHADACPTLIKPSSSSQMLQHVLNRSNGQPSERGAVLTRDNFGDFVLSGPWQLWRLNRINGQPLKNMQSSTGKFRERRPLRPLAIWAFESKQRTGLGKYAVLPRENLGTSSSQAPSNLGL